MLKMLNAYRIKSGHGMALQSNSSSIRPIPEDPMVKIVQYENMDHAQLPALASVILYHLKRY